MTPKLFMQIPVGFPFHYGDNPSKVLVKLNSLCAVSADGVKRVYPHVLVFEEESQTEAKRKWIQSRRKPK